MHHRKVFNGQSYHISYDGGKANNHKVKNSEFHTSIIDRYTTIYLPKKQKESKYNIHGIYPIIKVFFPQVLIPKGMHDEVLFY